MRCGHAVESCGSELFQSALTATISTTSALNHSIFAVRDLAPKLAMLDGSRKPNLSLIAHGQSSPGASPIASSPQAPNSRLSSAKAIAC
jgi:hypothetical protein